MEIDNKIINFYKNDINLLEEKILSYISKFELFLKSKSEYYVFINAVNEKFELMSEKIELEIEQFIINIENVRR